MKIHTSDWNSMWAIIELDQELENKGVVGYTFAPGEALGVVKILQEEADKEGRDVTYYTLQIYEMQVKTEEWLEDLKDQKNASLVGSSV